MASSRLRAPASSRWQLPELVVGATTTPMSGKQILRRPAEIMHTDTAPGQCVRLAARLDNGFGEVCKSFACARVASVRDHLSVLESSGDDLDSSKAHCCQSVRRGAELSCAPKDRERKWIGSLAQSFAPAMQIIPFERASTSERSTLGPSSIFQRRLERT